MQTLIKNIYEWLYNVIVPRDVLIVLITAQVSMCVHGGGGGGVWSMSEIPGEGVGGGYHGRDFFKD